MMKNLIYTLATLAMLAMTACGGGGDSFDRQQVGAEAAHAANVIMASAGNDTLKIQQAIIEAHAMRSKYVLDGNEEAAQYFDQVLADSLRAASPQLAAEIFGPAK